MIDPSTAPDLVKPDPAVDELVALQERIATLEGALQQATDDAKAATALADSPRNLRFAVYDLDLLRFVGPTQETKAKATALAKTRKVTRSEIREV